MLKYIRFFQLSNINKNGKQSVKFNFFMGNKKRFQIMQYKYNSEIGDFDALKWHLKAPVKSILLFILRLSLFTDYFRQYV